ncbi:MAG: galactose mutarotase [Gemmatirosa sp.]|nr:galactose mutarotase [Gemmatirosa sp.]
MPNLSRAIAFAGTLALACAHASVQRGIQREPFGTMADGAEATRFTIRGGDGAMARVTDYGATLTELWIPDRDGRLADVVLGFERLADYVASPFYMGATMGRVANRIANARFTLDGREYTLAANRAPHHIHGGVRGFDKRRWRATLIGDSAVAFAYTSPDGEEGYPGTLDVTVRYTLQPHALRIDYTATADRATPVNLSNHSFFNLAGAGTVLDHVLTLHAHRYTLVDASLIPTGDVAAVDGTPLDFTAPHRIGERIEALRAASNGYDHNFVLDAVPDSGGGTLALAARLTEPTSGRVLEILTTEPGMQLFTGNRFDGRVTGVGGVSYVQHAGVALETQHFPDALHHPSFPSIVLRPGATFRSMTVYRFTTDAR